MLGRWLNAWAKDLQRGCVYQFIAAVTVIPLIIILIIIPFNFASRPDISQNEFLIIILLPAMIFLIASIGGGWGAALLIIRKRRAWVDQIFARFHLRASRLNITGRQYHGMVAGREVDVLYQRGPILTVYVSTQVTTRLSVSDSEDIIRGIANIFHQEPICLRKEGLTIYAHEVTWAQAFLDVPEVRALLKELIFEVYPFQARQVLMIPGRLMLRYYRSQQGAAFHFSAEQASRWMDALLKLADYADAQPAPQKILPVSELHEKARKESGGSLGWVIAEVILLLMLLVLGLSVGAIYLFWGGI